MIKNLPANGGGPGDVGSVPWSGRPPGGGNGSSLQHSCLDILWTEEFGRVIQSRGSQKVEHDLAIKQQQHKIDN